MNFLKDYNKTVVKYDLINKFNYKTLKTIPKFESITLTFKMRRYSIKNLISYLSAIKIISSQTPTINSSKVSNISFKIRKGQPIGCKVTLKKKKLLKFLFLIINKIPSKKIKFDYNFFALSFKIQNILIFDNLEKNYQFFKNLSHLNINVTIKNVSNKEVFFFLKSHKLIT